MLAPSVNPAIEARKTIAADANALKTTPVSSRLVVEKRELTPAIA